VYLTDGYGDAPDVEPDYPVLWVCNSAKEMPIGETIRINV
jgi:predicted metal-dependent peptidase